MDIATVIGIVVGFGLVIGSILLGSSLMAFINVPGLLIVVGGTFAAALIAEKMGVVVGAARIAPHAFLHQAIAVDQTIARAVRHRQKERPACARGAGDRRPLHGEGGAPRGRRPHLR